MPVAPKKHKPQDATVGQVKRADDAIRERLTLVEHSSIDGLEQLDRRMTAIEDRLNRLEVFARGDGPYKPAV